MSLYCDPAVYKNNKIGFHEKISFLYVVFPRVFHHIFNLHTQHKTECKKISFQIFKRTAIDCF